MLLVRANFMVMSSGRGPPLPGASCGCSRHDRGHWSASSRVWTTCGSRRDSRDGTIAATTARAGYFALFPDEVTGPLGALAACHDRDAVERRFGDARGLLDFRTPRVSAEGTLAGRPLVVFVALVPAAWLRRRMFWFNKNCAVPFDKVNHSLYNAFCQPFDEGIFADTNYEVDIRNGILILTSNFATEAEIKQGLGTAMYSRIGAKTK